MKLHPQKPKYNAKKDLETRGKVGERNPMRRGLFLQLNSQHITIKPKRNSSTCIVSNQMYQTQHQRGKKSSAIILSLCPACKNEERQVNKTDMK